MNTKKILFGLFAGFYLFLSTAAATNAIGEGVLSTTSAPTFLEAVINSDTAVEVQKSTIFDASQSFVPDTEKTYDYEWDFGDGNKDQGAEVLHVYKEHGDYTVTLRVYNEDEESIVSRNVFAYNKLIFLITDSEEEQVLISTQKEYARQQGVHLEVIDSYGSASEFISEEVLTKKIT